MADRGWHRLLTPAAMAKADQAAVAAGIPAADLMAVAGAAVTAEICARFPVQPVLVLCGPGNNGGDGYVIARLLQEADWPVRLAALAPPSVGAGPMGGAAAAHAAHWWGTTVPFDLAALDGVTLIVDALYGAGLSRPLTGAAALMISEIARRGLDVVAVDLPSGVDGASGAVLGLGQGGCAAPAILTVTFARPKPGHRLMPGRGLCGAVVVADIGIPEPVLAAAAADEIWDNHPDLWRGDLPRAGLADHKYQRGHVLVLAGSSAPGAARLAARAARRSGAGLVTVAAPTRDVALHLADWPGTMAVALDDPADLPALLAARKITAIILGPGLIGPDPERARALADAALASGRKLVLDADIFTVFAGDGAGLRARLAAPAVLTPHRGEFARLFPTLDGLRCDQARAAARFLGGTILLKGADTVIAHPDGRLAINGNAPPTLATAGSGDVLAGVIGALLGGGMAPFAAACAGAWLHGAAAGTGPGVIAEDVIDSLAIAWHRALS